MKDFLELPFNFVTKVPGGCITVDVKLFVWRYDMFLLKYTFLSVLLLDFGEVKYFLN